MSLGGDEAQAMRRCGGSLQMRYRFREPVLRLRQAAEHPLRVAQRPLITQWPEQAQRLYAGGCTRRELPEGDLRPGGEQPAGAFLPAATLGLELRPALGQQLQGLPGAAPLRADERQIQ